MVVLFKYFSLILIGMSICFDTKAFQCQDLFGSSENEPTLTQFKRVGKESNFRLRDFIYEAKHFFDGSYSTKGVSYKEWHSSGKSVRELRRQISKELSRVESVQLFNGESDLEWISDVYLRNFERLEHLAVLSKYIYEIQEYISYLDTYQGISRLTILSRRRSLKRLQTDLMIRANQWETWVHHAVTDLKEAPKLIAPISHLKEFTDMSDALRLFATKFSAQHPSPYLAFDESALWQNPSSYLYGQHRFFRSLALFLVLKMNYLLKLNSDSENLSLIMEVSNQLLEYLKTSISAIDKHDGNDNYLKSVREELVALRVEFRYLSVVSSYLLRNKP